MGADGQWQPVARAGLRGGGIPRALLSLWGRRPSVASLEPLPASPYEVPPALRPALESAANYPGHQRVLSGNMMNMDPQVESAFNEFRQLRDTLANDAQKYLATVTPPAQPEVAQLVREASAKQIINSAYANSDGLVIGESHSQLGSKQFLIDNMPLLKKAKVKVLYLEHFMTDFQQAELDLFQQNGRMPPDLKAYVKRLDEGFGIDQKSRYSFENLLITAHKEGIRLQSIDCMASYRQAWDNPPSAVIRQQMMNFYAHEIIEADQALRGASKWVALVGNSHASTFEGVLGVGELQGAVSLRVEDIDIGKPGGVAIDPGLAVIENGDLSVRHLKSRLRLQVPIRAGKLLGGDLESDLRNTGAFTFKNVDDHLVLVHRSNDGQLKYTAIVEEGAQFYIDRPSWPWISARRMRSLWEIRTTLEHHGMHYIRS